jgi:hypothetical protein
VSEQAGGNGQVEGLPPPGTGRRRSLILLLILLVGLPVAFVLRVALDSGWRQVTSVSILEAEDVIYMPELGVFLVDGDPPIALDAASPHQGEDLAFCPQGDNFVSLAHGEMFSRSGRYIGGPAPRGMDGIPLRVRGEIVEINISERIPGPPTTDPYLPEQAPCPADNSELVRPGFAQNPTV